MMKVLPIAQFQTQMTMARHQKLNRHLGFFLCAFALTVIIMLAGASWLYAAGDQPQTYSLEARGEHLGKIIQKLAEMSGYEIYLDPKWEAVPITVSLRNVTLYEGLSLLLSRLNKVILVDTGEKKCSIMIFDSSSGQQSVTFVPPDVKSNPPRTSGNRQKILSSVAAPDPLDMEVLPPSEDSEKGTTLRELKESANNQNQFYDENKEVIPPKKFGQKGITARELAALRKLQNQIDPEIKEVLPPAKPGEKGITLRQFNEIQDNLHQINKVRSVGLSPKIPPKNQ